MRIELPTLVMKKKKKITFAGQINRTAVYVESCQFDCVNRSLCWKRRLLRSLAKHKEFDKNEEKHIVVSPVEEEEEEKNIVTIITLNEKTANSLHVWRCTCTGDNSVCMCVSLYASTMHNESGKYIFETSPNHFSYPLSREKKSDEGIY